ncbi:MAG: helix-turn-helix transcriptional regulator [Lewinellaceae bacterium]|nr:helix-turn-helix transcriptional regulator [Lewinellaceae bacterium]
MHPATQQLLVFLLGAAAFHGAYLSLLLFVKRKNTRESRLLGLVLGGVSLYLLNYLLFLTGLIRHFPGCLGVLYPWIFLAGGAFWFFVKTSLSGGFHWRPVHLLHFLPFLWAWYRVYPLLILPAERKQALIAWFLNPQEVFSPEMVLQGNVHLFLLLGYAVAARQWSAQREKQAERPENRRKSRWMKRFCTFFILLLVFDLGLKFSFVFAEIPAATAEYLLAAALALAIHRVGYFAMRRLDQHPGIPAEPAQEKYKTSPLTAEQLENSRLALLELMQRQKPWLDPELRIADLAEQLQLPSHHLSHILNEAVGAGFYDFVNGYRIREAQRLLLDERFRHFSIEAVGLESGFANKTTFNRVFKKMTGMSPSAYVERSDRVKPFTG